MKVFESSRCSSDYFHNKQFQLSKEVTLQYLQGYQIRKQKAQKAKYILFSISLSGS